MERDKNTFLTRPMTSEERKYFNKIKLWTLLHANECSKDKKMWLEIFGGNPILSALYLRQCVERCPHYHHLPGWDSWRDCRGERHALFIKNDLSACRITTFVGGKHPTWGWCIDWIRK